MLPRAVSEHTSDNQVGTDDERHIAAGKSARNGVKKS
jgi:hypothetical protein